MESGGSGGGNEKSCSAIVGCSFVASCLCGGRRIQPQRHEATTHGRQITKSKQIQTNQNTRKRKAQNGNYGFWASLFSVNGAWNLVIRPTLTKSFFSPAQNLLHTDNRYTLRSPACWHQSCNDMSLALDFPISRSQFPVPRD